MLSPSVELIETFLNRSYKFNLLGDLLDRTVIGKARIVSRMLSAVMTGYVIYHAGSSPIGVA